MRAPARGVAGGATQLGRALWWLRRGCLPRAGIMGGALRAATRLRRASWAALLGGAARVLRRGFALARRWLGG